MAYKIQYSQETAYRYPEITRKSKVNLGKWWVLLMVIAAVVWLRQNGIPDFLIPGDPTITRSAAVAFSDALEHGESVHEAITVFCETVIHGAGF